MMIAYNIILSFARVTGLCLALDRLGESDAYPSWLRRVTMEIAFFNLEWVGIKTFFFIFDRKVYDKIWDERIEETDIEEQADCIEDMQTSI